jgi:hypothetical protein
MKKIHGTMRRSVGALCVALALTARAEDATRMPEGYWSAEQARNVLDRTLTVRRAPSLDGLSEAEPTAVQHLLAAGAAVQRMYQMSLHPQSLAAHAALVKLDAERGHAAHTRDLLDLYRLFQGPIAVTLENKRVPFLPVSPESPGRNVWPEGITREEVDAWLAAHPASRSELLDERTVVRRATAESVRADLAALDRHPVLDGLHPGLQARLEELRDAPDAKTLYAVPYSVAWADDIAKVHDELLKAAAAIAPVDGDFAQYLRLRARDLQADDYEGGDAAWVRGRFGALNAQIGSYETYDDKLYGAKSFFSLSLLLRDTQRSAELARATAGLQRLEDALPYEPHKKVSEDIPIGVYDVIADFGQARSANTATILPNDPDHARKYGRTILMRNNIVSNPTLFAETRTAFAAAVVPEHREALTPEGELLRTLWHEIGHYLGPVATPAGTAVDEALAEYGDLWEEMKADLVSLWSAPAQREAGAIDDATLRAWYTSGVRRTLQRVQPLREQPYQTMQLMQMNYFLENGLLSWHDGVLRIDYDVYPQVVTKMLAEVLQIQAAGDRAAAAAFIDRYATWDEATHAALGKRIDAASRNRYRLMRYAAIDE